MRRPTVFPDVADEGVLAGLEVLDNVLVERVHVLHQPLGGAVVHLARVVHDGKVGGALGNKNKNVSATTLGRYRNLRYTTIQAE